MAEQLYYYTTIANHQTVNVVIGLNAESTKVIADVFILLGEFHRPCLLKLKVDLDYESLEIYKEFGGDEEILNVIKTEIQGMLIKHFHNNVDLSAKLIDLKFEEADIKILVKIWLRGRHNEQINEIVRETRIKSLASSIEKITGLSQITFS